MCRSRRELSNAFLLAKIGVDTAENEPLKVHLIFTLWDLIFTPRRPARGDDPSAPATAGRAGGPPRGARLRPGRAGARREGRGESGAACAN